MMESPNDNQIDQLLHRYGRDDRSLPVTGNGHGAEFSHLDADEMNAFAANAIPAAARTRYLSHLADCTDCRRIVTGLAVAVNPSLATGAGAASAAPANTIWRRLTSWIKPPTLRFAGPIVAVLCVAVIMGLVLRTQYGNQLLSGPDTGKSSNLRDQSPGTPTAPGTPSNSGNGGTVTPNNPPAASSPEPSPVNGPVAGKPLPPTGTPEVADKPTESPLIAKTPSVLAPVAGVTSPSGPPPAPMPAKDSDSVDKTKVGTEERENKPDDEVSQTDTGGGHPEGKLEDQKQGGDDPNATTLANQDRRGTYPPASAKKTGSLGTTNVKGGPMRSRNQEQASNQTDDNETGRRDGNNVSVDGTNSTTANGAGAANNRKEPAPAERTVSGRQFRRQGNAWVDTGYAAGYAVTNVKRGSEQYRGLVADEPGLRTVAEQLGGEVIVVWKGHAYRFR